MKIRRPILAVAATAIFLLGLQLLFAPWVFWIGGRFTPAGNWHGYAKFADGGNPYLVYVDVGYRGPTGNEDGASPLEGTGVICRADGTRETWQASLETESPWLDVNGKHVELDLSRPHGSYANGVARMDAMRMKGAWRNKAIFVAVKAGSGTRGVQGTFVYGDRNEFEAACRAVLK
jgi:hypothetical protein